MWRKDRRVWSLATAREIGIVHDDHGFIPTASSRDQNAIISAVAASTGTRPFNGQCARLNGVRMEKDRLQLLVSEVGFFDFLSTNVALMPGNIFPATPGCIPAWLAAWPSLRMAVGKLHPIVFPHGRPVNAGEALNNRRLANPLAVAVNIFDAAGRILLVKRAKNMAVHSGEWTVACTGSVDWDDTNHSDPLRAAAGREVFEELGFQAPLEQFLLMHLVVAAGKLQPVAILELMIDSLDVLYFTSRSSQEWSKFIILDPNNRNFDYNALSPVSEYALRFRKGWLT